MRIIRTAYPEAANHHVREAKSTPSHGTGARHGAVASAWEQPEHLRRHEIRHVLTGTQPAADLPRRYGSDRRIAVESPERGLPARVGRVGQSRMHHLLLPR